MFAAAFICLFLAYVFGIYVITILCRYFKDPETELHHFQVFFVGFILIGTYLNVWSLCAKVNYVSLIPLLVIALLLLATQTVKNQMMRFSRKLYSHGIKEALLIIFPVAVLLFLFAIIPPQHGDSGSYHFMSIRWIEDFKVVPGLANVHGRFGFNSTFFVTSAAFSFSHLFAQAIYPINLAVAIALYAWLINKVMVNRQNLISIVYVFTAIVLFRSLLIAISSPSPDLVSSVIVIYVFLDATEKIILNKRFQQTYVLLQLLLMAFAVTIKLSAVGLLPLALVFSTQIKWCKAFIVCLIVGVAIIVCPWLLRNFILTSHLVYPLAFTAIHTDWKVPEEILSFDRLLINNGPKLISSDWEMVDKMSFFEWFPRWIQNHRSNGLGVTLMIFGSSIVLLFLGIVTALRRANIQMVLVFFSALTAIGFWVLNSPDYRFGYAYIIAGMVSFLLYVLHGKQLPSVVKYIALMVMYLGAGFYANRAVKHLDGYALAKYWLKPMPAIVFKNTQPLQSYQQRKLNNNVTLFIEDSTHNWNVAPLPAYMNFAPGISAGDIEMRGNNIQDGFRIRKKL